MNKRKTLGKLGIKEFEVAAFALDVYALPTKRLRTKQENFIRGLYNKANRTAVLVQLPMKTYKRLNSKGQIEEIT
jgi:5,10-methylene-tetrahydrofolate dehydrogenase/methenyl tetrahydrofolate cyclohydrolase